MAVVALYQDGTSAPRLVLVDAGMVAKLYGHQQRHFVRLLVSTSRTAHCCRCCDHIKYRIDIYHRSYS